MNKRLEFKRKVKVEIRARSAGKCELCGAALKGREGEIDHIDMDALVIEKRELVATDGQLLCRVCHKPKTKADIQRLRKAQRMADKQSGAIKPDGKAWGKKPKPERIGKQPLPPKRLFG